AVHVEIDGHLPRAPRHRREQPANAVSVQHARLAVARFEIGEVVVQWRVQAVTLPSQSVEAKVRADAVQPRQQLRTGAQLRAPAQAALEDLLAGVTAVLLVA